MKRDRPSSSHQATRSQLDRALAAALEPVDAMVQIAVHREVLHHVRKRNGQLVVADVRHETETHTWFRRDVGRGEGVARL